VSEVRLGRAIGAALADSRPAHDSVILLGEDVAGAGGPFGVTRGLLDRFGQLRVRDTPISEAAIVGAAVGAALTGLRPVVEIMFMDFMTLAMDALVNQAAKAYFMFGGQRPVPLVVRTPHGGGLSAGPQHSQCLEAWFAHVPGLKVVCPSTPADAYGLTRSAIADPNPVIVVENKALYGLKGDLPDPAPEVPIGKGRVVRRGNDLTFVAYGATVDAAVQAATALASERIDAEIIDLRSLQPWDEALVVESLARTHRLVIAHEAVQAFGVGAEIAARMADVGFDELDAPIVRIGAPSMPVPFARNLENAYRPGPERLLEAARRVLA
jgi:pyruvate/2-oxoglutarate/acetoin dehydrogenase E1 component